MQRILAVAAFIQFFVCVVLAVAIPKATTISLGILMAGSVFVVLFLQSPGRRIIDDLPVMRWLALMLPSALVAFSSIWSEDPQSAYAAAICLGFPIIAYGVVAGTRFIIPELVLKVCHNGFTMGISFAVAAAAVDVITDQALSRWVFSTWPHLPEAKTAHVVFENEKAVFVSEATPNRRAIVLTCLLPAFIHSVSKLRTRAQLSLIAVPGLLGYGGLFMSTHSLTAQMAAAGGALAFLLAMYLPRITLLGLASAWTATWILVVPTMDLMANARLDQASWLPPSAAERVEIWAGVARDVQDKPIFGVGVGTQAHAAVLSDETDKGSWTKHPTHHPHNGFLQIWHELGGLGVLTFLVFGLWLIRRISLLQKGIMPYFCGLFAICAVINATGFGIWQHWLLSVFGLAAGLLRVLTVPLLRRAGS